MLEQQIHNYEEDLIFVKNMIDLYKARLGNYMNEKADFYKKIRRNRAKEGEQAKNK